MFGEFVSDGFLRRVDDALCARLQSCFKLGFVRMCLWCVNTTTYQRYDLGGVLLEIVR